MSVFLKQKIFDEFAQCITPERLDRFEKIAYERTNYVSVVLEDVYQPHNVSAVLRSCDCFGIQNIHIIEDKHQYRPNEAISKGAAQWLSLTKYSKPVESTPECFASLRSQGYTIVAATPHEQDTFIDTLPLVNKVAVVFGTERWGLSPYALENADLFVKVPMYGFTESLNISVSVAVTLYELTRRLRASSLPWRLSPEELIDLKLSWLCRATHMGEQIQQRLRDSFLSNLP